MPETEVKSFDRPDEVRPIDHGRSDIVRLGEFTIGRLVLFPGFRWSDHVKPIAGTEWCEFRHVGFIVSGRMGIQMADGSSATVGPGELFDTPPGHDAWVIGDEPCVGVQWSGPRSWGVPLFAAGERVLRTMLFTDIVDSTRMLERLGDAAWRERLADYEERATEALKRFRGAKVTGTGDGFLAAFDGAASAIRCAIAVRNEGSRLDLRTRSGIHTGEVELVDSDVHGVAVHVAARIVALAEPEEILVSGTTYELVAGANLTFADRGMFELRGMTGAR